MKLWKLPIVLFAVGLLVYFAPYSIFAAAGINQTINFQGKVVNKTVGTNIADGTYSFTFRIYDVDTAGTHIWTETKNLTVSNGIFQTLLGDTTSLPGSIDFNTDSLYLGINFNGDGEMSPRVRLAAVPYAFNALKVAGLTVSNTTGTLTVPNSKTVQFADAFTTSGAFPLTFTTGASTNVTLPASGTLATLAASEIFTNKTIGSTGLVFSGATTDIDTAAAEGLVIQGRAASTVQTTSGGITIQPAGSGTISTVQIGAGSTGSVTPDFLGLDVFNGTTGTDPAGGFEGAMYYHTVDNKFRCYVNAAWTDCNQVGLDSLDYIDFQDTLDFDADQIVNQSTNTLTQNFNGNTTTGLTYNANSLTTGSALVINSIGAFNSGNIAEINLSTVDTIGAEKSGLAINVEHTGTIVSGNDVLTGQTIMAANSVSSAGMVLSRGLVVGATTSVSGSSVATGILSGAGGGDSANAISGFAYVEEGVDNYVLYTGGDLSVAFAGGGTLTTGKGINALVSNNGIGTITDSFGGYFKLENAGVITNGYGAYVDTPTNSGTWANNYGLYINDQSAVGSTNSYNIYSAGSSAKNYFAGYVGIGDFTPSAPLEVGDGTDSLQVSSTGDITFIDANSGSSITGPAGGALSITSNTSNALTLDSGTTGAVNLGSGNNAKIISIGTGTAGNTLNLGTDNTVADTLNLGSALDTLNLVGVTNVTGTTTILGATTFNGSGAAATNIGTGTYTGTITIGRSSNTDLALNDAQWSISGAGAVVGAQLDIDNLRLDGNTMSSTTGNMTLDGAGTLTIADVTTLSSTADFTGRASFHHANNQGLNLPTNAGAPSAVTGTTEGDLVWDSTGNALYIYDGSAFAPINVIVDSLDYTDFQDTLDFDANQIVNQSTNTLTQNFTGTATTGYTYNADSATSGTAVSLSVDALQNGRGLFVESTSTGLTTGNLARLDWTPGSPTVATGDLFQLNIGSNGTVGSLFNVQDNGVSLFKITEGSVISAAAASFTSASGVSFSNNILMTNQTASSVVTNGPFTIDVGDSGESNNLTLKTYNTGAINLQSATVQIGTGGAGTTSPSILEVDVKSNAGDPSTANGGIYYNANTAKLRCGEGSAWVDCVYPGASFRNSWFIFEEWLQNTITAGTTTDLGNIGDNLWTLVINGTPTLSKIDVASAAEDRNRNGVLGINNPATNNAGVSLRLDNTSIAGVPSSMTVEFDWASTTNNIQQVARIGLHDSTANTAPTDGLYFQYNVTTTAANWFYCARNNTTETCTDSTVAKAAINTYQRFKIVTNSAGTSASYYIDDVLVGSISSPSTSLPASTRSYGPAINIHNNNNTVKNFKTDYYQLTRTGISR